MTYFKFQVGHGGHSQALEALEAGAGGPFRGVRTTDVIQLE